mgnify:CR=1 FL=1|jgi:hypothetical protein
MYYDEKYHCTIIWCNCYDHTRCPECTAIKKFIDAVNRREEAVSGKENSSIHKSYQPNE